MARHDKDSASLIAEDERAERQSPRAGASRLGASERTSFGDAKGAKIPTAGDAAVVTAAKQKKPRGFVPFKKKGA